MTRGKPRLKPEVLAAFSAAEFAPWISHLTHQTTSDALRLMDQLCRTLPR